MATRDKRLKSKPEERRVFRRNWQESAEGWPTHCIMLFELKVTGAKMCLAKDFTARSALQNTQESLPQLAASAPNNCPRPDHNEGMEPLGASQLTQWKRACAVENTNQSINERLQRWQTRTSSAERPNWR